MKRKQTQMRRELSHDSRKYFSVELGMVNHLNPAGTFIFPDRKAALKFAENHHAVYPHGMVYVRESDSGRLIYKKAGPREINHNLKRKVSS